MKNKSGMIKQLLCLSTLLLMMPWLVQCQKGGFNRMSPVLALITDFGDADAYVPQMKGAIYSINPGARVVDLSHRLKTYNIKEASYLLYKATRTLPPNTIVCAVVDPGVGSDRKGVAFRTTTGRIYVGPDNGIFTHILEKEGREQAVVLDKPKYYYRPDPSPTFHGRDIFGPVAAYLAKGTDLDEIGTPIHQLNTLKINRPTLLGTRISGQIVHTDHYGNVITNIQRTDLPEPFNNTLVKIIYKRRTLTLPLVSTFSEAPDKRLFALFNSDDELELSIKQSSAAKSIKPTIGDPVVLLLK